MSNTFKKLHDLLRVKVITPSVSVSVARADLYELLVEYAHLRECLQDLVDTHPGEGVNPGPLPNAVRALEDTYSTE